MCPMALRNHPWLPLGVLHWRCNPCLRRYTDSDSSSEGMGVNNSPTEDQDLLDNQGQSDDSLLLSEGHTDQDTQQTNNVLNSLHFNFSRHFRFSRGDNFWQWRVIPNNEEIDNLSATHSMFEAASHPEMLMDYHPSPSGSLRLRQHRNALVASLADLDDNIHMPLFSSHTDNNSTISSHSSSVQHTLDNLDSYFEANNDQMSVPLLDLPVNVEHDNNDPVLNQLLDNDVVNNDPSDNAPVDNDLLGSETLDHEGNISTPSSPAGSLRICTQHNITTDQSIPPIPESLFTRPVLFSRPLPTRSRSRGASPYGSLRQNWYIYDPRLVPESRAQRLTMETTYGGIHNQWSMPGILSPPAYDEISSRPEDNLYDITNSNWDLLCNQNEDPRVGEDPPPPYTELHLPMVGFDPPPAYESNPPSAAESEQNDDVVSEYSLSDHEFCAGDQDTEDSEDDSDFCDTDSDEDIQHMTSTLNNFTLCSRQSSLQQPNETNIPPVRDDESDDESLSIAFQNWFTNMNGRGDPDNVRVLIDDNDEPVQRTAMEECTDPGNSQSSHQDSQPEEPVTLGSWFMWNYAEADEPIGNPSFDSMVSQNNQSNFCFRPSQSHASCAENSSQSNFFWFTPSQSQEPDEEETDQSDSNPETSNQSDGSVLVDSDQLDMFQPRDAPLDSSSQRDLYPLGYRLGHRPPVRWSGGMGFNRWASAQNWQI